LCLFKVVKAEPDAVCPGEGTSGSRGRSPARSVHTSRFRSRLARWATGRDMVPPS